MKVLCVLVVIWLVSIASAAYWFIASLWLYGKFKRKKSMTTYITGVDALFKKAGTSYVAIYDIWRPSVKQRMMRDVAYLCDKPECYNEINEVFLVTIGKFRHDLFLAIFPLWVLVLPSYLIERNEIQVHGIVKILLNVVFWLISGVAAYLLNDILDSFFSLHYQEELHSFSSGIAEWIHAHAPIGKT